MHACDLARHTYTERERETQQRLNTQRGSSSTPLHLNALMIPWHRRNGWNFPSLLSNEKEKNAFR